VLRNMGMKYGMCNVRILYRSSLFMAITGITSVCFDIRYELLIEFIALVTYWRKDKTIM
jgi:hypothetical protein